MPFLNDLIIKSERKTDLYKLEAPLSYRLVDKIYTVPVGFETDFASIPKKLRGVIDGSGGDIRDAAVIHDWLYSSHETTRSVADNVLYSAMRELGANKIVATSVFLAVRLFGKSYYNQYTKYRKDINNG